MNESRSRKRKGRGERKRGSIRRRAIIQSKPEKVTVVTDKAFLALI